MKYTNVLVKIEELSVGENPRIPNLMALVPLAESIETIGLKEPIVFWVPAKGKKEVVRGHRRFTAIGLIKSRNPKRFEELFGKGIPALELSGVTSDEVVELKLDHEGVQLLSDPHELQRSANMLFAIGKTETEVANQLAGLIDRVSPMKQKARIELDAIKAKIPVARAAGNDAAVKLAEREAQDYLAGYRRGFVQNLHNTYRCPDKVMSALYKKATGQAPEGVTEYLPKIGAAEVTALWKCHKADLELKENGVPKYNKQRVGPAFSEKWQKLITDEQAELADTSEKAPRAKAMSAKDMEAEIKDKGYKSELACKLIAHHCGQSSEDLTALDTDSHILDLVKKYDKATFDKVVESGKAIIQRLIAEDNKANAKV